MKLQSRQLKRTPQDCINELIIWKMNPLVTNGFIFQDWLWQQLLLPQPVLNSNLPSCMHNEWWFFYDNSSVFGQIEKSLNG